MYRCEICNKVSEPNERVNKIIVNKRNKEYYIITLRYKRSGKRRIEYSRNPELVDKLKKEGWEIVQEKETKGWEIVSEINTCEKCCKQSVTQKEETEKK